MFNTINLRKFAIQVRFCCNPTAALHRDIM